MRLRAVIAALVAAYLIVDGAYRRPTHDQAASNIQQGGGGR